MIKNNSRANIRKKALEARKALSEAKKKSANKAIEIILEKELENIKPKHVMAYLGTSQEVGLDQLIKKLLQKKIIISIPKVLKKDGEMDAINFNDFNKVKKNKFQIREPLEKKQSNLISIDCILVPLVAVDKKGNRLGHGHGYYDRFLKKINAYKIGVSFECQVVNQIPAENHDVKLDMIVTESKLHTIKEFTSL